MFVLSLLALCPLAERVGYVTEEMAKYTNDTIGSLINATMGNITEVVVSFFALRSGLLRVVQVSLLGSILSNLLLVLGCAFLCGGLRHNTQKFNRTAAGTNATLLLLATMGLLLPDVLQETHQAQGRQSILTFSRITAVLLLLVYIMLVVYQLKTHRSLFEGPEGDDEEHPEIGFVAAFVWGLIITVFISIISEFIVSAIQGAASQLHLPILFIGGILLPIVGNAAEHAAAVMFAYRNKMDIALGISLGSAAQIALFVIPLCVVSGGVMGQPLSLDFHAFETVCVLITVIVVVAAVNNGQSDWLKGAMLLTAYAIIATAFWYHVDPEDLVLGD